MLGCQPVRYEADAEQSAEAGFLQWPHPASALTFAEALRDFQGVQNLMLRSTGQNRDWIERKLLAEGWIRHPGGMQRGEYPQWSAASLPELTLYQRAIPGASHELLGAGGSETDALIARYVQAGAHVRVGDTALIEGHGAEDAKRILSTITQASEIEVCTDIGTVADHSVGCVIVMRHETPDDWLARLDHYQRVLKFDGRLVLLLPRGDDQGKAGPKSWAELNEALSTRFLVECRYEQRSTSQDPLGPRTIVNVSLDHDAGREPLFAVAMANPLTGADHADEYRHAAFENETGDTGTLADFGQAYDNPWLYRTMVQIGERISNEETLTRLAEYVIGNGRLGSADQGAALTVYGYRVFEKRAVDAVPGLLDAIKGYEIAAGKNPPPHVVRWTISLAFLAGRLCELAGDRDQALEWYRKTAGSQWGAFSPILATKAIGAAFYAARLLIVAGDRDAARKLLRAGVDIALKAAAGPHEGELGDPDRPLPFYLTELAEVIDMGAQCGTALNKFHLLDRDPGRFWRMVDVRRFGLATWNIALERENRRLTQALAQKRA